MTFQIVLVFIILVSAVVLFVTEWLRVDVVALLVLSSLALTGLVKPAQALSGFSSPVVVTVWAVFLLSGGLSKTGIANIVGRQILWWAGTVIFFSHLGLVADLYRSGSRRHPHGADRLFDDGRSLSFHRMEGRLSHRRHVAPGHRHAADRSREILAEALVSVVGGLGQLAVVAGLFLMTALAAQVMPTAAVAVLLAPIALSTAAGLGMSPYALMMTVAMSSSASFLSPVTHPANVLTMGAGGYRVTDYIKVGFPLTLVVLAVVLVVLPIFWPLG